ncbi:hypothetical protein [Nocardioides sp.]|uniref:hypothetical protein n=1 Tax=Nocardioides sp. TaxID=35761 RepID=UPI003512127E
MEFEGDWLGAPSRFSLDQFHEGHTDDEVELYLRSYRDIALAYLDGSPEVVRSGRFGFPAVMLETTEGPVTFRRSVAADVGSLLRLRRRSGAARPRR